MCGQDRKTLVFCTSYAESLSDSYASWDLRYRIWIEAIRASELKFHQILIVDDGSAIIPEWPDTEVIQEGESTITPSKIVLYHFRERLGRNGVSDFPGWVRSFLFASEFAEQNGFHRVVHVESDAFLLSSRACTRINEISMGWAALWCSRYGRPESGIQVIAGERALDMFKAFSALPIDVFKDKVIENLLPFTEIITDLKGDRYGEVEGLQVPEDADWCMQAQPREGKYSTYFWWMPWFSNVFPSLDFTPDLQR